MKKSKKGNSYELREKFEEIKRIYLEKFDYQRMKANHKRDYMKKSKAKSCNTFHQKENQKKKKPSIILDKSKEVKESGIYESPFDKLSKKTKKMIKRYKDSIFIKINTKLNGSYEKRNIIKSTVKPDKKKSLSKKIITNKSRSLSKNSKKKSKQEDSKKIKQRESGKSKKNKSFFDEGIKFSKRFGTMRNKSMGKRRDSKKVPVRRKQITEKIQINALKNVSKLHPSKPMKLGIRSSIRKKRTSRKTPMSVGKVRFIGTQKKKDSKNKKLIPDKKDKTRSKSMDKRKRHDNMKFQLEIMSCMVRH
jgi:hypothetical protein